MQQGVYLGLDGRAALVTGAGAGVGRAIAFWLARAGCDVAIADLSRDAAERVADELRELDFTAIAVAADVRSERAVAAMVAQVVDKFDSLDVAVNCPAPPAGRAGRAGARDGERPIEVARAVMASCCRAEAAAMSPAGGGGALVNVAWGAGEEWLRPGEGAVGDGIDDLTRSLAVELARSRVRVNAILAIVDAADWSQGCATPSKHPAKAVVPERARPAGALERALGSHARADGPRLPAEDIGRVAVFLASDLSRKVTGQVLRIDAGAHPSDPPAALRRASRSLSGSKRG